MALARPAGRRQSVLPVKDIGLAASDSTWQAWQCLDAGKTHTNCCRRQAGHWPSGVSLRLDVMQDLPQLKICRCGAGHWPGICPRPGGGWSLSGHCGRQQGQGRRGGPGAEQQGCAQRVSGGRHHQKSRLPAVSPCVAVPACLSGSTPWACTLCPHQKGRLSAARPSVALPGCPLGSAAMAGAASAGLTEQEDCQQ